MCEEFGPDQTCETQSHLPVPFPAEPFLLGLGLSVGLREECQMERIAGQWIERLLFERFPQPAFRFDILPGLSLQVAALTQRCEVIGVGSQNLIEQLPR